MTQHSGNSVSSEFVIRPAVTGDVRGIRALIDDYAADGRLLNKAMVTLYEDIQEFVVALKDDVVVGCGALHIVWEDLAEVRTLAVHRDFKGVGLGGLLLENLIEKSKVFGIRRLFCLTFETEFFARHGFVEIEDAPVDHDVYQQLLESYDEGVAEMLDLEHVKPNTLGNTRMLRTL